MNSAPAYQEAHRIANAVGQQKKLMNWMNRVRTANTLLSGTKVNDPELDPAHGLARWDQAVLRTKPS